MHENLQSDNRIFVTRATKKKVEQLKNKNEARAKENTILEEIDLRKIADGKQKFERQVKRSRNPISSGTAAGCIRRNQP